MEFLTIRGLWRTFFRPNAFHHGVLNRRSHSMSTNVEIYLHMNTLLFSSSPISQLGNAAPTTGLTPSGLQTPASTSKVLRWKDMEAVAMEAGRLADEVEDNTRHSLFGTGERQQDVLNGEELWDDERIDVEELFL